MAVTEAFQSRAVWTRHVRNGSFEYNSTQSETAKDAKNAKPQLIMVEMRRIAVPTFTINSSSQHPIFLHFLAFFASLAVSLFSLRILYNGVAIRAKSEGNFDGNRCV
jgi:hypothetical protein